MNITDYNQNFQNQRAPPEASFRSSLAIAQSQNTIPLAPIQAAFRQLARDPLFQSTISNKTNFTADSSLQWAMARAEALFDAIYFSGQTNDRDIQQIHELSQEIEVLEKKLKADPNLSPEQKRLDQKCLRLAQTALTELAYFPEALRQYQSVQDVLDRSLDHMVDTMYSPLYPGESLSVFPAIIKIIESLIALEMQIEHLPENSSISLRLQENLNTQLSAFSFYLYEWHEEIYNYMEVETKDLLQLYQGCPPEKKEEIARQIAALEVQSSHLKKQLEDLGKLRNSGPMAGTIVNDLEEISTDLNGALSKLRTGIKEAQVLHSEKPMTFGDEEWSEFSIQRENEKRAQKDANTTVFGDLIDTLTHPENWSDSTKSIVFRLFAALQFGEHALKFSQDLNQAEYLRQQAEAASRKVTPQMQHNIDRVNARLGTLLSDKYERLLNNPQLIEEFSKGDDLLREGIREALSYFKSGAPDRQQLFQYLDAFRSKQYAKVAPSPFSHLSIPEWLGLFTKPEEETSSDFKEPVSVQNANQKTAMIPRAIGLMGHEQQFSTMIESEKATLMHAKSSLHEEAQKMAKGEMGPTAKQYNQQIASLQDEILYLEQNTPDKTSTLTQLASWMQSVEYVRFRIARIIQGFVYLPSYLRLLQALGAEDASSLKTLLKEGGHPDFSDGIWRVVYHKAVDFADVELLVALRALEVPYVNEKDEGGYTPLMRALYKRQPAIVMALIAAGADLEIQSEGGNSALHYAAFLGDELLIKLLLINHANTQLVNERGETPGLLYKSKFPHKDQSLFETDDYLKTVLSIWATSHALELGGTLPLAGKSRPMEGGVPQYFAQVFSDYVGLFANQYSSLKETEVRMLQAVLEKSKENFYEDPQKIYEDYKAGKPILIHTGFVTHAVSVYLHGEYIIVGNKGALTNKPLEIYKINPSKVTKEFIESTHKIRKQPHLEYKKWIDNLPSALEGTLEPLGASIEKGYPLEDLQTVGNCAWESTETTLFGILALKRLQEANPESSHSEIIKGVQKTFTEMTQFFQLESFENFLKTYMCEYHTGVPQQLGDREHFMIMKNSAYQHFATFSEVFSKKVEGIKALLDLDPEGKV